MIKTRQDHRNYDDTETFLGAGTPRADERHWRKIEDENDLESRPDADFDSNELTDGGNICTHCHEVIAPGQYVRRTVTGDWQHEVCSYRARQSSSS